MAATCQPGASTWAASAKPSIPITPGSTAVPSMRWWCRKGCLAGSSSVSTRSSPPAVMPTTRPVIGPPGSRASPPLAWRSSVSTPSAPATSTSPPAGAVSSRRTTGMPCSGGSMSMPAASMTFGIEPRLAIPICAQAVQSIATPWTPSARSFEIALHEQVVGGRVVGLARVPEPPGDRGEDDGRARPRLAQRLEDVVPAVGLDVEDEVELLLRLVGQEVADLEAAGVDRARRCARSPRGRR